MASTLEHRLDALMHEIRDMKKELILDRVKRLTVTRSRLDTWKALGKKVSAQWDHVSAVDEIIHQREKTLVKRLTVDSSIIVSSLLENEPRLPFCWTGREIRTGCSRNSDADRR